MDISANNGTSVKQLQDQKEMVNIQYNGWCYSTKLNAVMYTGCKKDAQHYLLGKEIEGYYSIKKDWVVSL